MNSSAKRSIEVDFFRGVVLIVIVLDHISGSFLSRFTLHAYAFCDSAEIFVFLGGYASAAAYTAVAARGGARAAQRRFLWRSVEIYRAYLLTAALTLLSGAVLAWLRVNKPMLDVTDWQPFLAHPLRHGASIILMRHQPFLSSVLPMYVFFPLGATLAIPLTQRSPGAMLGISALVWIFAVPLAQALRIDDLADWSFNPFAWQLMFTLGILCRIHPASNQFQVSTPGRWLTCLALASVIGFAIARLFVFTEPLPGHLKQNLNIWRVANFVCIAWTFAQAVRLGGIKWLADRLPSVITVGRTGLVCFVAGTVISLVVDTLTSHVEGSLSIPAALAGDAMAIMATLYIAKFWHEQKKRRTTMSLAVARASDERERT
jgi:hypothetical protein